MRDCVTAWTAARCTPVHDAEEKVYNTEPGPACGNSCCGALGCLFFLCGGLCCWYRAKTLAQQRCDAKRAATRALVESTLRGAHLENADGSRRTLLASMVRHAQRYTIVVHAPAGTDLQVWLNLSNTMMSG